MPDATEEEKKEALKEMQKTRLKARDWRKKKVGIKKYVCIKDVEVMWKRFNEGDIVEINGYVIKAGDNSRINLKYWFPEWENMYDFFKEI